MYTYPDKNDELTIELIRSVSPDGYWGESEEKALDVAASEIMNLKSRHILDAGCGLGRLFGFFSQFADEIFAVEPDRERYLGAVKVAESIDSVPVKVVNGDISAVPENKVFDIVVSSHVLQHVTQEVAENMVNKIAQHLVSGGLLIASTTHTPGNRDKFTIEYFSDGKRTSHPVDSSEFSKFFGKDGVLPVRMFSEDSVKEFMNRAGLSLIRKWYYHYDADNLDTGTFPDDIELNKAGDGKRARDVLYIFRKEK